MMKVLYVFLLTFFFTACSNDSDTATSEKVIKKNVAKNGVFSTQLKALDDAKSASKMAEEALERQKKAFEASQR